MNIISLPWWTHQPSKRFSQPVLRYSLTVTLFCLIHSLIARLCCVKYGWINLWLSFQYLVERIHTNYALQVRTTHVLCLSNGIMMECLLQQSEDYLSLFIELAVISMIVSFLLSDYPKLISGQPKHISNICYNPCPISTGQTGWDGK